MRSQLKVDKLITKLKEIKKGPEKAANSAS